MSGRHNWTHPDLCLGRMDYWRERETRWGKKTDNLNTMWIYHWDAWGISAEGIEKDCREAKKSDRDFNKAVIPQGETQDYGSLAVSWEAKQQGMRTTRSDLHHSLAETEIWLRGDNAIDWRGLWYNRDDRDKTSQSDTFSTGSRKQIVRYLDVIVEVIMSEVLWPNIW